ncbi:hypothetical protein EB73_40530 [Mycobacterium sp. SWH-M3]|nr:hypothetical protein EB73_40530 [Mycobacterium sp. SWH-M3]
MVQDPRCPKNRRPIRYGLSVAVVGIGIGIAGASGHAVAWAEPDAAGTSSAPDSSDKTSSQSSTHTNKGPKKPAFGHGQRQNRPQPKTKTDDAGTSGESSSDADADPDTGSDTEAPPRKRSSDKPKTLAEQADSIAETLGGIFHGTKPVTPIRIDVPGAADRPTRKSPISLPRTATKRLTATDTPSAPVRDTAVAPATTVVDKVTEAVTAVTPKLTAEPTRQIAKVAAVAPSPTSPTAPSEPEPLSPIEQIAAIPGRVVNAVLETLDITTSANGPKSPINFDPIDEAVWAAFRGVEEKLGLTKTPAGQQEPPKLVYTGPTTGKTPTVEQFLNAATAEYVLGGQPGDLKPFTVDGKQMESTNVLSGSSGKAWVTPDGQVIIAYQGTTGGTNLLANPFIAVSQVITDAQVIFTDTTPQAFTDSLAFEQEVEAAAIAQGYRREDIFVTGHSLGGWEAAYVAQQTGLGGIGFESPGLNSTVPGNGANSGFVNILTYGDTAAYFSTDLPGLQPFMPEYVPGGGSKPHYGSIVMIGDPAAAIPLTNASALWGTSPIGSAIFIVDILGNFFQYHLPGVQAYHLGVTPDPGVVPWLGSPMGAVNADYADMTIPELQKAASDAGTLIVP